MPVNIKKPHNEDNLYQRDQYNKGGISKIYWDYRDKMIMRYIKGERILDIGCGEGVTLEKLIKSFPDKNIVGIDFLKENVEICKSHNLPVKFGSVYNLDFENGCLDTCILSEVIEHLDNHNKALKEIYRVLKKDAFLVVLFPNDLNFKIARIITGRFKEAFYDSGHIKQWLPFTLTRELIQIGFKIIKIKNIPFYFWNMSLHSLIIAKKI